MKKILSWTMVLLLVGYVVWVGGKALYRRDLETKNAMFVTEWIHDYIVYDRQHDEKTYGARDVWQSPRQTATLRRGDCEDFAILVQAFYRWKFAEEVYVVLVSNGRSGSNHAVVEIGGKFYDPSSGVYYGEVPERDIIAYLSESDVKERIDKWRHLYE